jgi:hypothetical protein
MAEDRNDNRDIVAVKIDGSHHPRLDEPIEHGLDRSAVVHVIVQGEEYPVKRDNLVGNDHVMARKEDCWGIPEELRIAISTLVKGKEVPVIVTYGPEDLAEDPFLYSHK